MRTLRAWLLRLIGSFARRRRERDLADELASHVQMHIDDNVQAGMTLDEARRQALLKLGGIQQTKELYRDRAALPALDMTLQDLRFAVRLLRRTPGFAFVAVLTLALGIGANTLMFSVANTLLLRPLPYPDSDRLLYLQTVGSAGQPWGTSPPDFYEYRERTRTLQSLDAFYVLPFNLTDGQEPERVRALIVSSPFFTTLRMPPALGRGFTVDDERWGSHKVAILSDGLWRRRFAADPAIVGQTVRINSEPYAVVGILPPKFTFLGVDADLIVPMAFEPGDQMNSHSNYFLRMIGRLAPGATREAAAADLNALSNAIIARSPENRGTSISIVPLREALVRDVRRPVLVLLAAVGFVLLIACANLANLLLARGATRQREMVVRTAIGATRGRLIRQSLTESLVLSAIGAAAGLAVAQLGTNTLNVLSQSVLPRAEDIAIDRAVLTFTIAAAAFTGTLFGVLPAMYTSAVDVHGALRDGAHTSSSAKGYWVRSLLVVAELALALVLLVGAGLMLKSMHRLLNVDAGFNAERVLTMQINLPPRKYVDSSLERQFSPLAYTRSIRFFGDCIQRVRTLSGVQAVGAINGLPLMGEVWGKNITIYDRPLPADFRELPPIQYRVVAGDYFRALGIRMVSGRAFTDTDNFSAPKVAIVNQELVRRYWNGVDPVGKVISVNPPLDLLPESVVADARRTGLPADYQVDRFTVVGVAADVRYRALSSAPLPLVYVPYAQGSEGTTDMYLTVRSDRDPLTLISAIREQIRQLDKEQPVASVRTLEDRVSDSVARPRLQTIVLGAFAMLALLLAAIGIYGVLSYGVTQRTHEIGIRIALGAEQWQVRGLVLRQAIVLTVAGLVLGMTGALMMTRVLRTLLFEVSPTDPAIFAGIVVLLALIACLAAYLPARRATKVDPLLMLRYE